jgi:hypothetical protein
MPLPTRDALIPRLTRLRWRLRGAWLWPAFFGLTLVDAVLLGQLPVAGDEGTELVPALLLAGVANLVAVALLAPVIGVRLRRRRPDLPPGVAADYAGSALVVAVSVLLLAGGLIHRPTVTGARQDMIAQQTTARQYAAKFAPPEFKPNAGYSDTLKLEDDLFRTCVPGDDPKRWFCMYLETQDHPPGLTVDENRESNRSFNAPGGFR